MSNIRNGQASAKIAKDTERLTGYIVITLASAALLGASPVAPSAASAAARTSGGRARAARAVYLNERASLKLVSEGESTLGERGQASGTFAGVVKALLNLKPHQVNAVYTIYPRGGSITGKAAARYVVRGSTGYYGGTLDIVKGTGIYRHVAGTKLGISGTINRFSFALTVKAHGWIKY